jgi:hypothetical protein
MLEEKYTYCMQETVALAREEGIPFPYKRHSVGFDASISGRLCL